MTAAAPRADAGPWLVRPGETAWSAAGRAGLVDLVDLDAPVLGADRGTPVVHRWNVTS